MGLGRQTALAVAALTIVAAALMTSLQDEGTNQPAIFERVVGGLSSSHRPGPLPRPIDPTPRANEGQPFARLQIPSLRVDIMVVEGVSGNAMRAGAGHYPNSGDPGVGNVAIAGHRTGFGQPFRNVDRLRQGDIAILSSANGRFVYAVIGPFDGHPNPWVTHPLDWQPTAPTAEPSLTLTTADPPHTSKNRLIVRFRLTKSDPQS